ncbi:MAG TPA: hypothetical protein VFQ47_04705 [Nitrososphaera sp.]|jgi:hypothetical protein|nr:hypothetical protein [Nitrososphaera sp.]
MVAKKDEGSPDTLTLKEGYDRSGEASDKSSEINRQLAFAGIAIIWVFKTDNGGRQIVPDELFLPGLFLVLSLSFDLLQYVIKSEIWYRVTRKKEKAGITEFTVPPWINYFGDILYWIKIVATVSAYILLIRFLLARLFE